MLEDQRYIGTYVIGKHRVREIGSNRMKLKDESEWFKIPDHHPAIVNFVEQWDLSYAKILYDPESKMADFTSNRL